MRNLANVRFALRWLFQCSFVLCFPFVRFLRSLTNSASRRCSAGGALTCCVLNLRNFCFHFFRFSLTFFAALPLSIIYRHNFSPQKVQRGRVCVREVLQSCARDNL